MQDQLHALNYWWLRKTREEQALAELRADGDAEHRAVARADAGADDLHGRLDLARLRRLPRYSCLGEREQGYV